MKSAEQSQTRVQWKKMADGKYPMKKKGEEEEEEEIKEAVRRVRKMQYL